MAFRATLAGVVTQQDHAHRHHDEPGDDQENRPGRQLVAGRICAAQIQFAPLEQLRHGFDPLHHTETVIAFAERREHVFELDALADRIGQHALQPAARDETDLAAVFDQQDTQPVVVAGLPHAPRGEEVDGEVEDVAACDVIDGDHGDLGDGPLAQRRAQTVDMRHGLVREYPVGVRDVTRAVGALDIGDVFDAVGFGLCREARDEQQTEEEKEAFHNHGQK